MGNSNQITVSTELGDVVVHKMPLSDYAELLRALENLPKQLGLLLGSGKVVDFSTMDNSQVLALLPDLLANSWDDIAALLAVPTDKDAAFLLKLYGADALDIIDAVLELNDFARIAATIKKILARRAKTVQAPPQS